jgi:hypothetical protein
MKKVLSILAVCFVMMSFTRTSEKEIVKKANIVEVNPGGCHEEAMWHMNIIDPNWILSPPSEWSFLYDFFYDDCTNRLGNQPALIGPLT